VRSNITDHIPAGGYQFHIPVCFRRLPDRRQNFNIKVFPYAHWERCQSIFISDGHRDNILRGHCIATGPVPNPRSRNGHRSSASFIQLSASYVPAWNSVFPCIPVHF